MLVRLRKHHWHYWGDRTSSKSLVHHGKSFSILLLFHAYKRDVFQLINWFSNISTGHNFLLGILLHCSKPLLHLLCDRHPCLPDTNILVGWFDYFSCVMKNFFHYIVMIGRECYQPVTILEHIRKVTFNLYETGNFSVFSILRTDFPTLWTDFQEITRIVRTRHRKHVITSGLDSFKHV